jgi:hypothetical protein
MVREPGFNEWQTLAGFSVVNCSLWIFPLFCREKIRTELIYGITGVNAEYANYKRMRAMCIACLFGGDGSVVFHAG